MAKVREGFHQVAVYLPIEDYEDLRLVAFETRESMSMLMAEAWRAYRRTKPRRKRVARG